MNNLNSFKAQSEAERSGDILLSFASRWGKILRSDDVRFIFRRRYPSSFTLKRVFIYIASPFSEIIGSFTVKGIYQISLSEAAKISKDASIDMEELKKYFQGYVSLGCYAVHENEILKRPIKLFEIRETFSFFPPQSFIALSNVSSNWLDQKIEGQLD
jgi:predicted transcriptional regulator